MNFMVSNWNCMKSSYCGLQLSYYLVGLVEVFCKLSDLLVFNPDCPIKSSIIFCFSTKAEAPLGKG